jgi:hypothetical protein
VPDHDCSVAIDAYSGDLFAQVFLPLLPQWGTASLRGDI